MAVCDPHCRFIFVTDTNWEYEASSHDQYGVCNQTDAGGCTARTNAGVGGWEDAATTPSGSARRLDARTFTLYLIADKFSMP